MGSSYRNMDCMEGMKEFPDQFFDLAVVDPPYFSGPEKRGYYGRKEGDIGPRNEYQISPTWEIPGKEYFEELERVSKHYIIWGCNYFSYQFQPGRIIWDKCNQGSCFSDCEIAATDLFNSVRLVRYMWSGMFQGKSISEGYLQRGNKKQNEKRIHPTQKPIDLYRWIYREYTKPGMRILDTHVGSASSLIAAHEAGLEYTGFEISKYYYDLSRARLEAEEAQMSIKDFLQEEKHE